MPDPIGLKGTFELIERLFIHEIQKGPQRPDFLSPEHKPLFEGAAEGILDRCQEQGVDLSSTNSSQILQKVIELFGRFIDGVAAGGPHLIEKFVKGITDPARVQQTRQVGRNLGRLITKEECEETRNPPPSGGGSGLSSPYHSGQLDRGPSAFPNWKIPNKIPTAQFQPSIYAWKTKLDELKKRVEYLKAQPWYKPHLQGDYLQQVNHGVQLLEEFAIPQGESAVIEDNFKRVHGLIDAGVNDYGVEDKLKAGALFLVAALAVTGAIGIGGTTGGTGPSAEGGTVTPIAKTVRSKASYVVTGIGQAAAGFLFYLDREANVSNRIKKLSVSARHIPG